MLRPLAPSWVRSYDQRAVMRAMMANHTPIPTWALPFAERPRRKPSNDEARRDRELREYHGLEDPQLGPDTSW